MEPILMTYIRDVLQRLQDVGFAEALVAGGCLRDIDNNRESEVKDIDIFIRDRQSYLMWLMIALYDFKYRLAVPRHVAQYMEFEGVVAVHEFVKEGWPPLQIVVMNRTVDPMATIERHDFGICQIAYDGRNHYLSSAYIRDKANHTFTVIRCRNEKDFIRSMRRWARLSTKYWDWDLHYDDSLIRH